jgi:peptidylprolyl isomerase
MLSEAMNTNSHSLTLVALLFLIPACGEKTTVTTAEVPVPKPDEVFRKDLLAGPAEDVRVDNRTAKDYPDLKVTVDPASKPEGDQVLTYWSEASIHMVTHLASGKQIWSTYKVGNPETVVLAEGSHMSGLVFGCLGMKKGEVRNLVFPGDLGYGESGDADRGVPPNASLVVRAELVDFKPPPTDDFHMKRFQAGTGDAIRNNQWGRFNYTGVLAGGGKPGLVFDSTMQPGRTPFRVQVGSKGMVIQGWRVGLQGMKVGERRWLKIPPVWAYGEAGSGAIPSNATLIFEVELMSIDPEVPAASQPGQPGQIR